MVNQGPDGVPGRVGVHRLSVIHFLIALVVLLVTIPFVDQLTNGKLIEAAVLTLVLLSAVLAVGGRPRTLLAAALLVTPALVGTWVDHLRPDLVPMELTLLAAIAFVAFVVVHLLGFILRAPWVNAEVLWAAVATNLTMAILWAFAYALVARLLPESFVFSGGSAAHHSMAGFVALYFSFSTLTTVSFGDILPVSPAARMLAMMEAATGVLYVAVLIARLVALYSSNQPARSTGAPNPPSAPERAER